MGKEWSCKQSKADGLVLMCSILLQVIEEVLFQMISNGILLGVCLNWGCCGLLIFSFCFLFVVVPCWSVFALWRLLNKKKKISLALYLQSGLSHGTMRYLNP